MAVKAGTGYIDIRGDFSKLNSELSGRKLAGRFAKVGALAGGAIAAGIAIEAKRAVDAFYESNKIAKQTQAVLKSTGGAANVTAKGISNLATAISRKTGVDDEAVQSGENLLLTFTKVRDEVGKGNDIFTQSTKIVTDMSVALGQDMKSSAIQVGKALNDPIKGVTALQRVGVSFTAQQKDQIKTLVDSGKTLDAQKLILRELRREFGGSAAAQATSIDKLKVAAGNLEEDLGSGLAPAVDAVAGKLTKIATDVEPQVIRAVDRIAKAFGRKDLSLDQKFRLSYEEARKVFEPLIAEGRTSVERMHLGDKLSQAVEYATPKIADAMAKSAPRVAGAFIHSFANAGPWGRLVIGGVLLKKMGGLGAFATLGARTGTTTGAAFGAAAGAAAGPSAASAMSISWTRVAGGGLLANVGKTSGKQLGTAMGPAVASGVATSGLKGRLAGMLQSWGPALAIALGVAFGPELIKQAQAGVRKSSPKFDLPSFEGSHGGVPVLRDLQHWSDRVFDADKRLKDFGSTAESALGKLRDAGNSRGMAELADQARKLAREFPQASGELSRFASTVESELGGTVTREFRQMRKAGGKSLVDLKHTVADTSFDIKQKLGYNTRVGREALAKNFNLAAAAVKRSMDAGVISTKEGTRLMNQYLRQALAQFGIGGDQATRYLQNRDTLTGKSLTPKGNAGAGHQRGGPIHGGAPSGDTIPAMLERGEYVLNREAVKRVGHTMLDRINFGLAPRFQTGGGVDIPRVRVRDDLGTVSTLAQRAADVDRRAAQDVLKAARAAMAAAGPAGGGETSTHGLVAQVLRALAWARGHGWHGGVTSGFRSSAEQARLYALYKAGKGNLAAPPGHSSHELGQAIDVSDTEGFARAMAGAPPNARLLRLVAGEPWHFSVTGHQLGGLVGLQTGGTAGKPTPRQRELAFMQGIWAKVAPLLGQDPALNFRKLFSRTSFSNKMPLVGVARTDSGAGPSTAANSELYWPRWLFAGGDKLKQSLRTKLFVHEMAHRFQKPGATASTWEAEGGAEAFARDVMYRLFGGIPKGDNAGDPYSKYVKRVGEGHTLDWIRRGQFGLQTGGLVGFQPGGLVGYKNPYGFGYKHAAPLSRLGGALNRTLRKVRVGKSPKLRHHVVGKLLERIKAAGLPAKLSGQLKQHSDQAAIFGDYADRAATLSTTDADGNTIAGVFDGKGQAEWLTEQLGELFQWRNALIRAQEVLAERREKIIAAIEQARKRLADVAAQIGKAAGQRKTLAGQLTKARKHPKVNGALIKRLTGQIKDIDGAQKVRTRVRDALKDRILPALTGKSGTLKDARGDALSNLDEVQGLGSSMKVMSALPQMGVLGGTILTVQSQIRDLTAAPPPKITDTGTDTGAADERVGLLEQLLREANLRTQVSERQFDVLRNMPPYGGAFKDGGFVPGPVGAPRMILAHGGELVSNPEQQAAAVPQVNLHFANGMEWLRQFVRVEVESGTRQMARQGARALPGTGGGLLRG